jgi:hypothetical protein
MYILNRENFFIINDAHDITMVTLELMRIIVLSVARGMFRIVYPCGQTGAPTLNNTYEENKAPNNITSDARKSQMPSLAL